MAGAVGAVAWAGCEPLVRRLCRTPYSDIRMMGRLVTRSGAWLPIGVATHVANGAAFAVLLSRVGVRTPAAGVMAAELEVALLWPGMVVLDRLHPDRRSGRWPRLLTHRPTIAEQIVVHAVYGGVTGFLLLRAAAKTDRDGGSGTLGAA